MQKLQYFGYLIHRVNPLEKTLILGKIEGRRRGRQKMRWLDSVTESISLSKLEEMENDKEAGVLQSMGSQRVGHDLATERQLPACKSHLLFTVLLEPPLPVYTLACKSRGRGQTWVSWEGSPEHLPPGTQGYPGSSYPGGHRPPSKFLTLSFVLCSV